MQYSTRLQHAVPPTNTKIKPLLLAGIHYMESISAARQKPEIVAMSSSSIIIIIFKLQDLLFSQLRRDFYALRVQIIFIKKLYQSKAIFLKYVLLALLSCLLKYLGLYSGNYLTPHLTPPLDDLLPGHTFLLRC